MRLKNSKIHMLEDNNLLKKTIEKNKSQIVSLEIVKGEAIKMNEGIMNSQNKLFYVIKKIHKTKYDQIKLILQVKDM